MAEEQVKVEHRPGQSIKMSRPLAEAYLRGHPGARILGDPPAAAAPAAKAVKQEQVEDKAVPGPRTARREERG